MTHEETMAAKEPKKIPKIKTPFARITVRQVHGNPRYSITFHDPDGTLRYGYSTHQPETAFHWMIDRFEIPQNASLIVIPSIAQTSCNGCRWKGRHQKCSCCRRNRNIKDCYEEA